MQLVKKAKLPSMMKFLVVYSRAQQEEQIIEKNKQKEGKL